MPTESKIQHAKYSGEGIFCFTPTIRLEELENPHVMGLCPGDIALNTHWNHKLHLPPLSIPQEILIIYGKKFLNRDWCGWLLANYFAEIVDGSLEEFAQIGNRVHEQGMEKVTFRKKS